MCAIRGDTRIAPYLYISLGAIMKVLEKHSFYLLPLLYIID
jgi:hypothetical protein